MSISQFDTHEIFNQPPAFEGVNLFGGDVALQDAVAREGAASHRKSVV